MQRQLPQYPALPTMVDYGWEIKSAGSRWFEIFQKNIKNEMKVILMSLSVQFSCSVVSDSLRPHEPQHARPPCPSPTPRVHPNPCP